jgi:outer membrane lipoprotein-sorting protein
VLTLTPTLVSAQPPAAAPSPTLDTLLESFADMPGLSARFTEEKRTAMLLNPIVSEGEIAFAPPNRLLRRVTSPTTSVMLVDGADVVIVSGSRREEIPLSENATVASFVDTFRQLLAGDREALERTWRITFTASGQAWRIRLLPRAPALRRFVREMVLRGTGLALREIIMIEQNGDRTTTRFSDVNPEKRWTRDDLARVFRI